MAYNQNIPQASDQQNNSQTDLLNNFLAIKVLVDINHVTFDDPSGDQGKHKWVSMPEQGSDPATTANEVAVYAKNSPLTSQSELFMRNESNGTVNDMTAALQNAIGWSFLPSGILLKWGNSSGSGLVTFTYASGATIPAFSAIYAVLPITSSGGTTTDSDKMVTLVDSSTTQFRVYCSQRTIVANQTVNFEFLAIGI